MIINFSKEVSSEKLGDFMASVAQHLIAYDDQGTFNKFTLGCSIDSLELPAGEFYVTEEGSEYYVSNTTTRVTVVAATVEDEDELEDDYPQVNTIDDYIELDSHSSVVAVINYDDRVVIVTNNITAEGHDLGRYAITLNTASDQILIDIKSLDYEYRNGEILACHPHINSEGDACYGNLGENIALAANAHDVSMLGILLLEFLSSVNTDDSWGERVQYWPEV